VFYVLELDHGATINNTRSMNSTLTQKSSPYNHSYKRRFFLVSYDFLENEKSKVIFFGSKEGP
jgi:hypothetical protein